MGNNTGSSSVVDVGQHAKHEHRYRCGRINVMFSGGTLLEHIPC